MDREKEGVIYVHSSLNFTNIGLVKHYKDQDIEICALKLEFNTIKMCVLTMCIAPTGNFSHFLHRLETIFQILYTPTLDFIICGVININYLTGSERKSQLDTLLLSYNLSGIINFPTKVQNASVTAIDNMFIDTSHMENIP
jgi:hypothetical protein